METIIPALIILSIIGGIVGLLVFVNNRDRKKAAEADKKHNSTG